MTTPDREPVYEVVWPLAPSATAPTALAARTTDLAGKTIGELWDYLFKGNQSKGYVNNHIQGGRVSKRVALRP